MERDDTIENDDNNEFMDQESNVEDDNISINSEDRKENTENTDSEDNV